MKKATFGAGCFWGVEDAFKHLDGVVATRVGYTGGAQADPTYEDVCGGRTGHAEAVEVVYDPGKLSYEDLLELFFEVHDPTTLNRQGADVGSQYRSAVFVHDAEQRDQASAAKEKLAASASRPIVTEIVAAGPFYPAEDYHQDYHHKHGMCRAGRC